MGQNCVANQYDKPQSPSELQRFLQASSPYLQNTNQELHKVDKAPGSIVPDLFCPTSEPNASISRNTEKLHISSHSNSLQHRQACTMHSIS